VVFELLDELLEEKGVEARDARALAARVEKILRHAGRGRERLAARHLRRLERQVTLERHGGLLPRRPSGSSPRVTLRSGGRGRASAVTRTIPWTARALS